MRYYALCILLLMLFFLIGTPGCKQAQDEPKVSVGEEVQEEAGAPVAEKSKEVRIPKEKQETSLDKGAMQEGSAQEMEAAAESETPAKGLKERMIEEVKEKGKEIEGELGKEVDVPSEGK